MIGGVAVREAPDNSFYVPTNGSNSSLVLDEEALKVRRVQVAVVLTSMVGVIQVSLPVTGKRWLLFRRRGRVLVKFSHAQKRVYPKQQAKSFWMYHLDMNVFIANKAFPLCL